MWFSISIMQVWMLYKLCECNKIVVIVSIFGERHTNSEMMRKHVGRCPLRPVRADQSEQQLGSLGDGASKRQACKHYLFENRKKSKNRKMRPSWKPFGKTLLLHFNLRVFFQSTQMQLMTFLNLYGMSYSTPPTLLNYQVTCATGLFSCNTLHSITE